MSLPPGFLDELRSRLSLSDVVGRKVMWDTRKSNRAKGDWWAPCPFHQEKTASFHVMDRQGYYYCFGCQAKGDAITFVRELENVGFMEAVEILAAEAGMDMPAPDPRAREAADRRTVLADAMDAAVRWMRLQMRTAAARDAAAYLERRGLSEATLERFEIGFAPAQGQAMLDALTGQGHSMDVLIEAGLAAESDRGDRPYARFRDRIIFPIRNARGRCIALGGRAMQEGARAKYLNSPETPLFDKGRNLYHHGPARAAVGKGAPLIVAEGYMDVIALAMAGFEGAVAPLGTAITEDQLRLMWKIADEPIIALDGDAAGQRAGHRLIDLALPMLEAGKSLRFVTLPQGKDPDDLIRDGGASAMQSLLDGAEPLSALLWRRETADRVLDSPERRAALDRDLRQVLNRIGDPGIKAHYATEFRRQREALFGFDRPRSEGYSNRGHGRRGFGDAATRWTPPVTASARASLLASPAPEATVVVREAVILAAFLSTPALLDADADVLEERQWQGDGHGDLAAALLACAPDESAAAARARLEEAGWADAVMRLLDQPHVRLSPPVRAPGDLDRARLCLAEECNKLAVLDGSVAETAEAEAALARLDVPAEEDCPDAPLTWRLREMAEARARALRAAEGDRADFDIADNGVRIDRGERASFDALLASLDLPNEKESGA